MSDLRYYEHVTRMVDIQKQFVRGFFAGSRRDATMRYLNEFSAQHDAKLRRRLQLTRAGIPFINLGFVVLTTSWVIFMLGYVYSAIWLEDIRWAIAFLVTSILGMGASFVLRSRITQLCERQTYGPLIVTEELKQAEEADADNDTIEFVKMLVNKQR